MLPSTKHRNETVFCPHTGSGAGEGEGRRVCSIEQESGAGSTAMLSGQTGRFPRERGEQVGGACLVYSSHIFQSNKSPFNFPPDSGERVSGAVKRVQESSAPEGLLFPSTNIHLFRFWHLYTVETFSYPGSFKSDHLV